MFVAGTESLRGRAACGGCGVAVDTVVEEEIDVYDDASDSVFPDTDDFPSEIAALCLREDLEDDVLDTELSDEATPVVVEEIVDWDVTLLADFECDGAPMGSERGTELAAAEVALDRSRFTYLTVDVDENDATDGFLLRAGCNAGDAKVAGAAG